MDLRGCSMLGVHLSGADLRGAILEDISFVAETCGGLVLPEP